MAATRAAEDPDGSANAAVPPLLHAVDAEAVDLWRLAGLPGGLLEASYLVGPLAAQYRLIVDVLLAQQQHTLTGVAADELRGLLRADLTRRGVDPALLDDDAFNLPARMRQLVDWRVVDVWQDRARRDEDFLRNLDRYQLTPHAAELHRAVTSLGHDAAASAAATLAPGILTAQLVVLRDAVGADPAAAAEAWGVINPTLQGMATAAAGWQARLAGALAGAPDPEKVAELQTTLRHYVDMWGAGIDTHSEQIATEVRLLRTAEPAAWRRVALHTLGAGADDARVAELVASYAATLQTLHAWFDGGNSQGRRLRRQMRDAIAPMVRGQRTLAAVGGHVSRRAELLALASRLERARDDAEAWTLWCAATGLFSARHLPGAAPMPGGNPAAVSFWDAAPAPVEARLRQQGPRSLTGRPARIADRRAGRAAARAAAAAAQHAAARTRAAVTARSGQRLSQWREVTAAELELLLTFLGALAAAPPDATGRRTATTGDGLWQLRADPPEPGAPAAVIPTDAGRLVHPDVRLHVGPAGTNG